MQGSQDIAVHVGTLHFTAKAVIEAFGDDINPGDVFAINDPYLRRHALQRRPHHPADLPRRRADRLRAVQRPLGRRRRQRPGLVRHHRQGPLRRGHADPAGADLGKGALPQRRRRLIVSNTRAPEDTEGDLQAQAEATRVAEREILRLVRQVRRRHDPHGVRRGPGLRRAAHAPARSPSCPTAPGRPRTTSTSTPPRARAWSRSRSSSRSRATRSTTTSRARTPRSARSSTRASAARSRASSRGTKTFFPDVPLNSGFYRAVDVDLGPGGHASSTPPGRSRSPASAPAATRRS